MKYAIFFAASIAFVQYALVPNLDFSAVAAQQAAHNAVIEEAFK